jgi:hypothetical protein
MTTLPTIRQTAAIDEFLEELKKPTAFPSTPTGGLIFALDATASRGPTWDGACRITGEMFEATAAIGGLEIQLVYYRGFSECKASRWLSTAADLQRAMHGVSCVGGNTQIERVLSHAIAETRRHKINALVFIGDCMEETVDRLCHLAGELGSLGVPVFLFHEDSDATAAAAFKQIATLSKGAYCRFDRAGIDRLRELLGAIAVYATAGRDALLEYGAKKGGEVLRITAQLQR